MFSILILDQMDLLYTHSIHIIIIIIKTSLREEKKSRDWDLFLENLLLSHVSLFTRDLLKTLKTRGDDLIPDQII